MGSASLVVHIIVFPFYTAPQPTVVCSQVIVTGSLVGAVVGACIGTALLYTVILLVWVLWNKRHMQVMLILLSAFAYLCFAYL